MTTPPPPDLVPARMLNEVTYCPRLFWLEHVAGEWAGNADTVSGRRVHRRADRATTAMPPPDDLPPEYRGRSITVSAPDEGLVAKTDVVEAHDGAVVPVDYKRGDAPDPLRVTGGAWPADRVQVGAQAMALRAEGYRCDVAVIYYAGSKTRVEVPVDQGVVDEVRAAVTSARVVRSLAIAPPPLVDSPKCPRCSLVGICLPDETTLLRSRVSEAADRVGEHDVDPVTHGHAVAPVETEPPLETHSEIEEPEPDPWGLAPVPGTPAAPPPRQLVSPRRDGRALYVQSHGGKIGKKAETLDVWTRDSGSTTVALGDLECVGVFGNVSISPAVLSELCSRGIPIALFSHGGWFHGTVQAPADHNVHVRLAQFAVHGDPVRRMAIAREIVRGKILNQRVIVRRNARTPDESVLGRMKDAARQASVETDEESLLGIEGSAAREYFSTWNELLAPRSGERTVFDFTTRNRRPPRDPVNAMLSLGYAILTREATQAVRMAGMDPSVGVFHKVRPGRPALALDLMEEFRPLVVDSVVLSLVNTEAVGPADFVHAAGSVALTDAGRRAFLLAFERRMSDEIVHPTFGYRVNYRRAIEVQARLMGRVMTGELPEYVPFRTR